MAMLVTRLTLVLKHGTSRRGRMLRAVGFEGELEKKRGEMDAMFRRKLEEKTQDRRVMVVVLEQHWRQELKFR